MTAMQFGVLTAMRSELRPFVRAAGLERQGNVWVGTVGGHHVVATTMGVGMTGAARTTERILAEHDVEQIMVVGIAGGLDPDLPIGHVVVPEVVVDGVTGADYPTTPWADIASHGQLVTFHEFLTDSSLLGDLQRQGFAAIDMETAAVVAVCEQRSIPCTVFRAISDDATNGSVDPEVAAMARPDGSPDVGAAVRYLARRPWRVGRLAALGRDAARASKAAADAAVAALTAKT
jgi:adenosylhomocysteine nucleosidase